MNLLMFVATVLDPRFKMEVLKTGFGFIYDSPTANEMIQAVETMMRKLYAFYKEMMNPSPPLVKDVPIPQSKAASSFSSIPTKKNIIMG